MMVTNANFELAPLKFPTWLDVIHLEYSQCPLDLVAEVTPHSKYNKPSNMGYILYSPAANIIFGVFTGTSNECLVGLDINYYQAELEELANYAPGIKGHRGIYRTYLSIRGIIVQAIETIIQGAPSPPQLILTGHSLGGALSTLAAFDLAYYKPIHYSFASLQVFNPLGANMFDRLVQRSYRIANLADLVTISPLSVMPNGDLFSHVGTLYHFQRNLGAYAQNHALAYLHEFEIDHVEATIGPAEAQNA
jgi:predicted lipase